MTIEPKKVHETLGKYIITDGFDIVLDLDKSKGCQIYDSRHDKYLLDCFSFFASAPLGCNHPKLTEPDFVEKLGKLAVNNPTNSDVYTSELADFVDTFGKIAVPSEFKHLFFISGGALAVENAIKTAFDWKVRKNISQGKGELGSKIIHFKEAFHGRTGYTLSMTNTFNLDKIRFFPRFYWPRIINPKVTFPLNENNISKVKEIESQAIYEIEKAIEVDPDDIAGLIIEPIQGEGGDNHFRKEFFIKLRQICNEKDIMFILDEVQSGMGMTGKMWAYQNYDFVPDIVAFGKKTQVCGIMVNDRVDEVKDNVFNVSSRLNSTWGGSLVDMFRCQKYLEVINEENLVKNSETQGKNLLKGLNELGDKYSDKIFNIRGKGLMCAFDLETPEKRDKLRCELVKNGLMILGCGASTIRFRPPLIVSDDEINQMLEIIEKTLSDF